MAVRELRIDVENMISKIDDGESSDRKKPTIHKVPNYLRQGCPNDYEPQLISIGPLHRHKSELRQMDHLKWAYLKDFIQRTGRLELFIDAVWKQEKELRKQYSVDIHMEKEELVKMLLLDGCFLLELFIKGARGPLGPPWGDARWNIPMLRQDLLLLENQIPFSVLIALFGIAFPVGLPRPLVKGDTSTLRHLSFSDPAPFAGIVDLALNYVAGGKAEMIDLGCRRDEIHHLLHLNHIWQLLHFNTNPTPNPVPNIFVRISKKLVRWGSPVTCFFFFVSLILMCKLPRHHSSSKRGKAPSGIPSAKNLKEAGIKFKKKHGEGNECFLNVSFNEKNGSLEIPFLDLNHGSSSFFRNLIALEQCCRDVSTHFTAYATFMDSIIDTAEDAEILVTDGIIEHNFGTHQDVADLFNNICNRTILGFYDDNYLGDLFRGVNDYCDSDQHRWRAALVNRYFQNPWAVASVIAAFVLLLLALCSTIATILQTIYAVKAYKKQFD